MSLFKRTGNAEQVIELKPPSYIYRREWFYEPYKSPSSFENKNNSSLSAMVADAAAAFDSNSSLMVNQSLQGHSSRSSRSLSLSTLRLGELILPAPHNPHAILSYRYGSDYGDCVMSSFSHRLHVGNREGLTVRYPCHRAAVLAHIHAQNLSDEQTLQARYQLATRMGWLAALNAEAAKRRHPKSSLSTKRSSTIDKRITINMMEATSDSAKARRSRQAAVNDARRRRQRGGDAIAWAE